jgi:CubicO group peptidase (beta-lactamase class C family)
VRTRASRRRLGAAVTTCLLLAACSSADEPGGSEPPAEEAPSPVGGDWPTAEAAAVGLDPIVLEEMAAEAAADGSSCFLVARDGQLVGEWYWNDTGPETAQEVWSVTKSVTGLLVGIAAEDGDLSIADSAAGWIPEWAGTAAEAVTVEHLLSNDSGRAWTAAGDTIGLVSTEDQTAYAIALEQAAPPGTVWRYNNAAIQTLEQVLEVATGEPVVEFAHDRLLAPLGMDHSALTTDAAGNGLTFMGLQSTCRDLARFGWLVVQGGSWGDDQVVPEEWIERSTEGPSQDLNASYGYLWWQNGHGAQAGGASPTGGEDVPASSGQLVAGAPDDLVWALGLGGQIVQIHEASRTVLVRLGPPTVSSRYSPAKSARLVTEAIVDG